MDNGCFHYGSCTSIGAIALLYPPIVIDDSSWKNTAESFTIALTLTLGGGVRKCNSTQVLVNRVALIVHVVMTKTEYLEDLSTGKLIQT